MSSTTSPLKSSAPPQPRLRDLATVIRSKLAGPFRVTFDVIFDKPETYREVVATRAITRASVAALYGVRVEEVTSLFEVPMANAIKFTMVRRLDPVFGPRDSHSAQQHVPLMEMRIPIPQGRSRDRDGAPSARRGVTRAPRRRSSRGRGSAKRHRR